MNAKELLASFAAKRVCVIGDTIIDIETRLERIKNDDRGVPTYRTILDEYRGKTEETSFGGAALVVRNLLELGARVDFITASGYGKGALAAQSFHHPNLRTHGPHVAKPQTVKHRFWCDGKKVMQVDTFDNSPPSPKDECSIGSAFNTLTDVIVIADYRHGLLTQGLAEVAVSCRSPDIPVYVASQISQSESNHHWYKGDGVTLVLNETEWESVKPHAFYVRTRGGAGSERVTGNGMVADPAIKVDVVDTCGAGDAFLAALALTDDTRFANIWAGLSCTVRGPNPPTQQMLIDWCEQHA